MPTNTIEYLFMYSIRMVVYCTLGNGTCDGKAVSVTVCVSYRNCAAGVQTGLMRDSFTLHWWWYRGVYRTRKIKRINKKELHMARDREAKPPLGHVPCV